MQKYWRDRAFDFHRTIKSQGIRISRDSPAEIFGAFLTYFTRQELLESGHGEALMDLLQGGAAPRPYVILDDDLGIKRIANLLEMPAGQAYSIAQLFMSAFEELAPGQVFRSEQDFVHRVVLPRVRQALEASREFAAECSAIGSDFIRVGLDHWDESERYYQYLPNSVPQERSDIDKLRKLRDDKGHVWRFHGVFDLTPVDRDGQPLPTDKYPSWVAVRVDFDKLDRAILAAGPYDVALHATICKAWSGGGPFDVIAESQLSMVIDF